MHTPGTVTAVIMTNTATPSTSFDCNPGIILTADRMERREETGDMLDCWSNPCKSTRDQVCSVYI